MTPEQQKKLGQARATYELFELIVRLLSILTLMSAIKVYVADGPLWQAIAWAAGAAFFTAMADNIRTHRNIIYTAQIGDKFVTGFFKHLKEKAPDVHG